MSAPFSNETTSMAAAHEAEASGRVMTQRQRVLVALEAAGDAGATHEQLSDALGIGVRQVSTRVRSLVLDGMAMDSGRTTRSRAGASVILWVRCTQAPQCREKQTHGRIAAAVAREREECADIAEAYGALRVARLIVERGLR